MASASAARRSHPARQTGSAAAIQPRGWVASAYLRSRAASERRGLETAAAAGTAKLPDNRMENSRRVGPYDRFMFRCPLVTCLDRRTSPYAAWITPRALGDDASRRARLLRNEGPGSGEANAGRSVEHQGFLAIGKRSGDDRRVMRARRRGRDGLSLRSCHRSKERADRKSKDR